MTTSHLAELAKVSDSARYIADDLRAETAGGCAGMVAYDLAAQLAEFSDDDDLLPEDLVDEAMDEHRRAEALRIPDDPFAGLEDL